jgi:hypothetical protein
MDLGGWGIFLCKNRCGTNGPALNTEQETVVTTVELETPAQPFEPVNQRFDSKCLPDGIRYMLHRLT